MSDLSKEELRAKVVEILKASDLTQITSKKIRIQLEKDLDCSLISRKAEIDEIALSEIQKMGNDDSESESSASSSEDMPMEKLKRTRACAPPRKAPVKRKKKTPKEVGSNSDSDNAEDEDYKSSKKAKKTTTGRKNGYTRPYTLSPELSELMGAESLPRHEVVKKIWAYVKENNLYDPKNKQFAICDPQLMKVMKIKRFRTFGMLKYLKPHFLD